METGIYDNLDFKEYRSKLEYVSISELNLFLKLPIHYKHQIIDGNKEFSTKSQDEGVALHAAVLEEDLFKKEFGILPDIDLRTKEGKMIKAQYDEVSEATGKKFLKTETFNRVIGASESLKAHPEVKKLLPGLKAELSFFNTHQTSNMPIKARLDGINETDNVIIDVKSTQDAKNFHESVFKYNYHRQVAFYLDIYEQLTGKKMRWQWWVVEMQPPYISGVYEPTKDLEIIGRDEYERGLFDLKRARETGQYPGLTEKIQQIFVPNWYLKKTEKRKIGDKENGV